ncbi:efflux RND transporter permease subunit [Undibacterium sp. SXout7W]|uniref:efflux RND transporter permease subunit n=1 Tax=Undibacterium sp. SXout7W TaxID=3413049 RepID=UPI003BF02BDB
MLNKFVDFVLTQRVFVLVLTLALMIFGYRSFTNLPIEAFPDVQDVQVQIVTQFPGQAAEEVERSITLPIEREMSGVPGQTQLRSVSITGLSVVTITFKDGTDDYFARQQVLEKLQGVSLPVGIQASIAPLTTAVGEIYRYIVEAPADMSENDIRALQDWVIRPELRIVSGVADVVSFGGTVKEYQVQVDPNALKRYSVTLDQVNQALANNSSNVGGGTIRRGDEALVVRGIGLFSRKEDIGQVIVSAKNGKTVLIADVADVSITNRQRSGIVSYNKGDSYVLGIVQMTKGGNAAKIIDELKKKIEVVNTKLPKGVKLKQIYDRTELLHHTIMTVFENLVVGAVLVMTILIIFLKNWRAALIVVTVIPLSLMCAFIMLDIRGIPANLISLGAVDFGIIIDSAVVLVEALMVRLALKHHEEHGNLFLWRKHVLKDTVVEMGHPILFAKAIIILAFIPIFTFQRVEGKIFSPVALTLSFAMLGALILTMTLIPTLLTLVMKKHSLAETHSEWMHRLQTGYRQLLQRAEVNKQGVMLGSSLLLILTLGFAPKLGSEFLPKLDEGNIWLTISLPPSTALEKTKDIERQVRIILLSYPEVKSVVAHVGRPDDGTDPKGPNNMEILADLQPHEQWKFADKESLIENMTARIAVIPGVPTNFSQVIQDSVEESLSGVKGEIAVKIFGPNLDLLTQKSEQIATVLRGIQGATDVDAVKIGGQSELNIVINREKIARLGINVSDVNNMIQTALADVPVSAFFEGDKRFDITVRLKPEFRESVDRIGALQVSLPNGAGAVELADIANIEIKQGAGRISREAGGRNASVKANLLGRDQGSFVAEAQKKVSEQVMLPPGYYIVWGGQFENQQRAVKRLEIIVPITIFLIFAFLFWAFRSVRMAGLILMMVPFTMIGGVAGLAVAGLHFSVSAAVGFIAVAGISVQNGVIMLEQILDFEKTQPASFNSSIEGAVARLRPILMTALMAGLGLLPAALSHGIGSETQRPFAVVIVGGIVSATIFTLLLLPLSYTIFKDKLKEE